MSGAATDKPHWRTVIKRMDPAYLYAEDLGPAGTTVDVEVISAGVGKVKNPGGSKELIWIGFRDQHKKLGLNATNAKTMEALCGSGHWGDWRGWIRLVVLHKDAMRDPTAEGGTSPMDVIRIAPARPAARQRAADLPAEILALIAEIDACADPLALDALKARVRAGWDRIPKGGVGGARDRVGDAIARAASRLAPPDQQEQDEILAKEASEQR